MSEGSTTKWWQAVIAAAAVYAAYGFVQHLKVQEEMARAAATREEEAARAKQTASEEEQQAKQRAYLAKRRGDCYDIYVKERAKWNNVSDLEYDEEADQCSVIYKEQGAPPKYCKLVREGGQWAADTSKWAKKLRVNCITGTFTKAF